MDRANARPMTGSVGRSSTPGVPDSIAGVCDYRMPASAGVTTSDIRFPIAALVLCRMRGAVAKEQRDGRLRAFQAAARPNVCHRDMSGLTLHREWPPDCYAHGLSVRS
jgi:hypothetical protein